MNIVYSCVGWLSSTLFQLLAFSLALAFLFLLLLNECLSNLVPLRPRLSVLTLCLPLLCLLLL